MNLVQDAGHDLVRVREASTPSGSNVLEIQLLDSDGAESPEQIPIWLTREGAAELAALLTRYAEGPTVGGDHG